MKQPMLVILEVPDDTPRESLREGTTRFLRQAGYDVIESIPLSYTLDVPDGAISG